MLRNVAHQLNGDVAAGATELAAAAAVAAELRQPPQLWMIRSGEAMLALATGKFAEAETLMAVALEFGERALPEAAIPHYELHRYALADFRGQLEVVEPQVRGLAVAHPARPVFRCALAHVEARLGRLSEAQRALDDLAADDSVLPFDQEWLYGMSLLAETAALVGDTEAAARLYPMLVPWAAFNAVDVAEGFRGSVARYLGILATTTGRLDDAQLHFEDALAANERMGALPWLALTQNDYARMLFTRDRAGDRDRAQELLDGALATFAQLGMQAPEAPV